MASALHVHDQVNAQLELRQHQSCAWGGLILGIPLLIKIRLLVWLGQWHSQKGGNALCFPGI